MAAKPKSNCQCVKYAEGYLSRLLGPNWHEDPGVRETLKIRDRHATNQSAARKQEPIANRLHKIGIGLLSIDRREQDNGTGLRVSWEDRADYVFRKAGHRGELNKGKLHRYEARAKDMLELIVATRAGENALAARAFDSEIMNRAAGTASGYVDAVSKCVEALRVTENLDEISPQSRANALNDASTLARQAANIFAEAEKEAQKEADNAPPGRAPAARAGTPGPSVNDLLKNLAR